MPASRSNVKASKNKRSDEFTPVEVAGDADYAIPASGTVLTEEQLKLRNMIPALTPAHGPDSTATAILAALSLGSHRPNSHTRRKSEGHVNRPPNAFIVFRRAQVQNMPANVTQHQQRISNLTALFWRVLTTSEQNTWYALSDDIKKLHNILFPDYNFNPRNPDGTKKSTLPRAGLTSERLEFAWNEAQLLIQKHTVMGEHPPAPPASLIGKVARPKAPRKGQGTRAKERREQEAAQRAAAAALATAEASGTNTGVYSPEPNAFVHSYFATVDEESSVASPPSESPIAWRPDFSLEGSVSSRSSPTNSWTELVGPLDSVDPFDNSYTSVKETSAETPVVAEDYPIGQFGTPFSHPASPYVGHVHAANAHLFAEMNANSTSFTPPAMQKQVHHFTVMPSNDGYAHYYEEQSGPMNAATILGPSEFSTSITGMASGHVEAQYIFHDMDPTATYMDIPSAYAISHAEYAW